MNSSSVLEIPRATERIVPTRLPSLDGWRAIAILMVFFGHTYHADNFPKALQNIWLFDLSFGILGVRFFFVISGFLITWLLLKEIKETGRVSLRNFWVRRAFRILPAYGVFLLGLAVLQVATEWGMNPKGWIAALTFTTNYLGDQWLPGHLWSLSVEEQFYLIWPILIILSLRTRRGVRLGLLLLLVPFLLCPIFRVIGYLKLTTNPIFSGFSFFLNADSLAVGCCSAFIFAFKRDQLQRALIDRFNIIVVCSIVSIALPYALSRLFIAGIFTVPFGPVFQALGFANLMLLSIFAPEKRLFFFLNLKAVSAMGVISYSLYLWQQIFCAGSAAFGLTALWLFDYRFWWIAPFAIAFASYRFVEQPALKLRKPLLNV